MSVIIVTSRKKILPIMSCSRICGAVNVDGVECNRGGTVEILSIGLTLTASLISKDRFEISGTVGGTMVLEAEGVVP